MALTNTEEKLILQSIQNGQTEQTEILLANNMGLIYKYVRKYNPNYYDDVFQEACIGFLKAADRYEFDRGTKFSTYATFWIAQAANRGYQKMQRDVRLPSTILENISKIKKIILRYMTENHRPPTVDELSMLTGIDKDKVVLLQRAEKSCVSLDEIFDDEYVSLINYIEDPDAQQFAEDLENQEFSALLNAALNELSDKEKDIIQRHFGLVGGEAASLAEIARSYNVSRERIRQIKDRALAKLRNSENSEELANYL